MESLIASGQATDSNLTVDVSLVGGRCETVSVLQRGTIDELKIASQYRRSAPRYFLICGLAQVKCLSQWSPCKSCFLKMYRPHSSFSWLQPIQLSVAIWSALRQCLSLSFSVGWSGFTQCSLMKRGPGDCFEHFPLVCSGAEFSQLENFRFLIFTCDLGPT